MQVSVIAHTLLSQSIAFGIKRNGHVTALSHEPALLQSFIDNTGHW